MYAFLFLSFLFALLHADGDQSTYKFTIIHTNDVHGWINGHPRNESLDATLGDLYNFVEHKKANAEPNEIVLMFDSGDLSHGTGLSDATDIQGEFVYDMVKRLPYDALCPGNHELVTDSCVANLAKNFAPHWNGSYISANVKYLNPKIKLTDKYTIIELPNNRGCIIVFGFMFSMQLSAKNVYVSSVSSTLATDFVEEAFARAGADRVKLCVCLCHIGTSQAEAEQVRQNLQSRIDGVPLVMLMGHSHSIAYKEDKKNNVAFMESGSYMQVVGVLTATVTETPRNSHATHSNAHSELIGRRTSSKYTQANTTYPAVVVNSSFSASFSHTHVTANKASLMKNANIKSDDEWATTEGNTIDSLIKEKAKELHIYETIGCSDRVYEGRRIARNITDDPKKHGSLYTLMVDKILPHAYGATTGAAVNFFVQGTSLIRGALPAGPVDSDDVYTIIPFAFPTAKIPNVSGKHMLKLLNSSQPPLPFGTISLPHERESASNAATADFTQYYECSNYSIDASKKYTIIGNEYDIMRIIPRLLLIAPLRYYPVLLKDTSPLLMIKYITDEMKCQASDYLYFSADDSADPSRKTRIAAASTPAPHSFHNMFPIVFAAICAALIIVSIIVGTICCSHYVNRRKSHAASEIESNSDLYNDDSLFITPMPMSVPLYS